MIRVISDIHLEFHERGIAEFVGWMKSLPKADTLVLAGDVCTFKTRNLLVELLRQVSGDYSDVIYVLGNHEYYHAPHDDPCTVQKYRDEIAPFTNVHLLENETMKTRTGLKIWGSTFWSDIHPSAYARMSDSYYLSRENYLTKHNCAIRSLGALEDKSLDIVVTHHMPSHKLTHPKYLGYGEIMNSGFSSHCDKLLEKTSKYWIYGHTHTPSRTMLNGVDCVCNPAGYPGENHPWWSDVTLEAKKASEKEEEQFELTKEEFEQGCDSCDVSNGFLTKVSTYEKEKQGPIVLTFDEDC